MIESIAKYTGVIMAGGKSKRMGTDKGLMLFKGKLLVQYSIDLLRSFCSEIIISTENQEYAQFELQMVADLIPECGPMGGIYSAFKFTQAEILLTLACDMPFVTPQTIERLLENQFDYDCVVPRIGDKLEPLCAIYSRSLFSKIESRIKTGNLSMHGLIMESNYKLVDFEDDLPDFRNLNTKEEFEKNKCH